VPASQTLFSADGRLLAAVHTAGTRNPKPETLKPEP